MDPHIAETVELTKPAIAAEKYFFKSAINLAFEFGAASHAGLCRAENQDHYVIVRRRRTQELLLSNFPQGELVLPPDDSFGMAVADGMGGTSRGDLASRLAIRAAWELAGRTTSWVMKLADLNTHELTERVEGFTYLMQKAFEEEVESNPQFAESGTTWTLAYFVSSFAVVANIGDSPCFLWRDGIMGRISTEHTVEQEFVAAGRAPGDRRQISPHAHPLFWFQFAGCPAGCPSFATAAKRPIAVMHGRSDGLGRPSSASPNALTNHPTPSQPATS